MAGRRITVEFLGQNRDLDRAMTASAKKSTAFGSALKKAGKVAAVGLAAGAAIAAKGLYEMTQMAVDDQAAQVKLANTLRNAAGASAEQVAATEKWITAQGKALGITDDDLRPALGRLVAATHDVGEAQRLASLAFNVSAGTGKSLEQVTTALAKAQNGSVAGLGKLGVATKNAKGETLSFKRIQENLAKTYKGAAAKQADTLGGKLNRLKVIFTETGEAIGARLIPMLTHLAEWFGRRVLPEILKVVKQFRANLVPSLKDVGRLIQSTVIPALQSLVPHFVDVGTKVVQVAGFLARHRSAAIALTAAIAALVVVTKVHTALLAIQAAGGLAAMIKALPTVAALTRAWAAVQWVLNAALAANPIGLVVVAIAALAGGLVLAYKKSETFRKIVDGAFAGVAKGVKVAVDFIKRHWKTMLAVLTGPIGVAVLVISKHWSKIRSGVSTLVSGVKNVWRAVTGFLSAPIKDAVDVIARQWEMVTSGFRTVKDALARMMSDIKTRLGRAWRAMLAPIQAVIDKVQWLIDKIKSIPTPDFPGVDVPFVRLGEGAMSAYAKGLEKGGTKAQQATKRLIEKLKDQLSTARDAFAEIRDSVAGSFTGGLFDAETAGDFLGSLTSTKGTLGALKDAFKTLTGWGLKPGFLAQLFQSGNAGLILDLAKNKATAQEAGDLFGGITASSAALGGSVAGILASGAGNTLAAEIKRLEDKIRLLETKGGKKQPVGDTINIHVDGKLMDPMGFYRTLEQGLTEYKRKQGRPLAFV